LTVLSPDWCWIPGITQRRAPDCPPPRIIATRASFRYRP
jgi:hypothetical protein